MKQNRLASYEATVRWRRLPDERFIDGRYSRAHEWQFDGGAQVHASASPHVVRAPFSDPSGADQHDRPRRGDWGSRCSTTGVSHPQLLFSFTGANCV
jgi:hypothetical protein